MRRRLKQPRRARHPSGDNPGASSSKVETCFSVGARIRRGTRTEVPLFAGASEAPGICFAFSLGGVCALPAAQRGRAWSVRAARSRSPRPARARAVREGHGRPRSEATPARAAAGRPGPLGLDCVRAPSNTKRPPGRSTRLTSATAARSSGIVHNDSVHTTVSKVTSSNSSACASPSRKSTDRPSATARRRAMSSIAGTNSIPVSRTPSA